MGNIFAGLESLGISDTEGMDIYQEPMKATKKKEEKKEEKKELTEEDLIFEKSYTCPVCDFEFKSKMIRTGKVRLAGADSDLRPRYMGADSLKYDAILCPHCGYAALNRYFSFVMSSQAKRIKEKITSKFHAPDMGEDTYSYDDAILRYKMALLNTVVKNAKNSERAYTCLKMAWLHRGKREEMMKGEYKKEEITQLYVQEKELLTNAFDGFEAAFSKEDFPMCGMDKNTVLYLLAELARRTDKMDECKRYLSRVLTAKDANSRIKNKALEMKEKLK